MVKKLNILMVTEAFYPDGIGGAHTYVYNLSKSLIKQGHNVYVITIKARENSLAKEEIEGIHILRYKTPLLGPLLFIMRPLISAINSRRQFCSIAKRIKFDLINFHSSLPAFGINIFSIGKKIPKVYTFHSSMADEVKIQIEKKRYFPNYLNKLVLAVIKLVEKSNFKACQKIIVLSSFSSRCLMDAYKQNADKIIIISGGVDIGKFTPAADKNSLREKLSLPTDKIIFLTARRLVARMGLENLICAMENVTNKHHNVLLLVLGDGFLKSRLSCLIETKKLKKYIVLLGAVDMQEIPFYYQSADVFVMPTEHDEWFGLVTIEALSCGLPVLGTPVGGTAEILTNIDKNLLFSGTTAKEMADGILRFLENKSEFVSNKEKFRTFVAENYSWGIVCQNTEKVYYDLL